MITLKTDRDLAGLRRAAGVVGAVLAEAAGRIAPGVTTGELDRVAEQMIRDAGGRPAFKGYRSGDAAPFPGSLCVSVNDVVVHGIPGAYALQEGDVVTVDCGVELEGYFGDFAYTFPVGEISDENRALLETTKASLYEGIAAAVSGNRIGDIGHAVQRYCEARGYGVVRALVGHGIGRQMHEDPQVPNVGYPGRGKKLREGMTLCIEPMINRGTAAVTVDADGWTVRSADRQPSAHFEHMIAVRRGRPEVLSSYDAIEAALATARGEAAPAASMPEQAHA
ncbi:MAG TPA: type I methionyl aminopeptidase [Rhodothermales bacterium]|nr:type I methionyl aminopeptidase [Rhodothermales bacterium]